MKATDTSKTFWQVLNENQVEIPVIQRDYAQGRQNERVNQIRSRFVDQLIMTLADETAEPLHLDFVYGRIEGKDHAEVEAKNKEAIQSILKAVKGYADNLSMDIAYEIRSNEERDVYLAITKLIPLDGQQRLTTLFLLHWYILQRIELPNKAELLQVLKGFRYKTRKSTTEFFEFLTNLSSDDSSKLFRENTVSQPIEKSTKFYRVWKNDPTVKGILVMLDALHAILQEKSQEQLSYMWQCLTVHDKVSFDFLDLDKLDQTDELYVKMNARGKQLTDFEHFKAWLQEENKNINYAKWEEKLDTDWLDLFWHNKPKGTYEVDDLLYNFFKSINLFEYITYAPERSLDKGFIEKIRNSNKEGNYIPLKDYTAQRFFTPKSLEYLFTTLDSLTQDKMKVLDNSLVSICCPPFTSGKKLSSFFINDNIYPTLPDRAFYYAYTLFINEVADNEAQTVIPQFQAWMRICRNLIYNTYIQNPDNFINALKSIKELAKHKFTIEEDLLHKDLDVAYFEAQAKEEKRKLRYFALSPAWREKIISYENHEYFYGRIDFLFELLGADTENFDLFVKYGDRTAELFTHDIERDKHLLQRTLLTIDDYLIHVSGNKYSFCKSDNGSLRARNDNWRKFFDNSKRLSMLKTLLDDGRPLLDIKDAYQGPTWRYYFIKHFSAIDYCKNRFIDFYDKLDIRLIRDNTYSGKHTDLYLYVLLKRLENRKFNNFTFKHKDVNHFRTANNFPSIEVYNNGNLFLSINYSHTLASSNKGFEIRQECQPHADLRFAFEAYEASENDALFKIVEDISEMEDVLDYTVEQFVKLDSIID